MFRKTLLTALVMPGKGTEAQSTGCGEGPRRPRFTALEPTEQQRETVWDQLLKVSTPGRDHRGTHLPLVYRRNSGGVGGPHLNTDGRLGLWAVGPPPHFTYSSSTFL